jgi:hypothetical protein
MNIRAVAQQAQRRLPFKHGAALDTEGVRSQPLSEAMNGYMLGTLACLRESMP